MASEGEGKTEVPDDGTSARVPAIDSGVTAGDYERLRELLLGDERRELAAARARIAELERTQGELPRRLPDAAVEALRENGASPRIVGALAAPVAQALGAAVHNNRQGIVDALFPVIGPMIRRAIAEALRNLVGNLNSAIESSFTLRGLKWRLEAWRAGVPYAQVVLRHRLAYGIDHVFLVERGSGLLLHHASAPGLPALDADAIAGMLTALGDFVGDSVGVAGGALESAQVGESLVWVEHGPQANLACFVHGVPPAQLRTLLEQRVEEIHAQILALPPEASLQSLGDDPVVRELTDPLRMLNEVDAGNPVVPARRGSLKPVLLIGLCLLLAAGWLVVERWRWQVRLDALRETLAAQPGFVLGRIDARPWRSVVVHGLLDPDAPPLQAILDHADLGPATRRFEVSGFVSADDRVVERRALRLLQAPATVKLGVHDGTLHIEGTAAPAWVEATALRAPLIAGVLRVESSLQAPPDPDQVARAALEHALAEWTARQVSFVREDEPTADAQAALQAMVEEVRRIQDLARAAGVSLNWQAVGSSDESGSDATNARVRALRVRWLVMALAARGIADISEGDARRNTDPTQRSARLNVTVHERRQ